MGQNGEVQKVKIRGGGGRHETGDESKKVKIPRGNLKRGKSKKSKVLRSSKNSRA